MSVAKIKNRVKPGIQWKYFSSNKGEWDINTEIAFEKHLRRMQEWREKGFDEMDIRWKEGYWY